MNEYPSPPFAALNWKLECMCNHAHLNGIISIPAFKTKEDTCSCFQALNVYALNPEKLNRAFVVVITFNLIKIVNKTCNIAINSSIGSK